MNHSWSHHQVLKMYILFIYMHILNIKTQRFYDCRAKDKELTQTLRKQSNPSMWCEEKLSKQAKEKQVIHARLKMNYAPRRKKV